MSVKNPTKDPHTMRQFSYEDLIACSKGELFGDEYGRLPAPPLLMFDRILDISKEGGDFDKGYLIAELDIKPDLWFFQVHFKGDPVMPGCLGLDALWQLLGFFQCWRGDKGFGRAVGGEVKFTGEILPTTKLVRYEIHPKRFIKRNIALAIGTGRVIAGGKEIYTANNLRVGQFQKNDLGKMV